MVSEFCVKEDEHLYKVYDNHYRRYVDTNIFLEKRISEGFNIQMFEKNRGLSPFNDGDPFICRISMEWKVSLN